MRAVVCCLVLVLTAGCGTVRARTASPAVSPTASPAGATALAVTEVPVPPIGIDGYDTAGSYPQVSGEGLGLDVVNRELRAAFLDDERSAAAVQRGILREQGPDAPRPDEVGHGIYSVMGVDSSDVIANSAMVSVMRGRNVALPGGHYLMAWVSRTVLVPSGQAVGLGELFAPGVRWLEELARLTKAEVKRRRYCVDPSVEESFSSGLAPKLDNYHSWALTPDGLDIGLDQGQIGAMGCGIGRMTLPWRELGPYLSSTGKQLASDAAQAVSTAPCSASRAQAAFDARGPELRDRVRSEAGFQLDYLDCAHGWAVAEASADGGHNSGTGEYLVLQAQGLGWVERSVSTYRADGDLEAPRACDLVALGVPSSSAEHLGPSCATPSPDSSAAAADAPRPDDAEPDATPSPGRPRSVIPPARSGGSGSR